MALQTSGIRRGFNPASGFLKKHLTRARVTPLVIPTTKNGYARHNGISVPARKAWAVAGDNLGSAPGWTGTKELGPLIRMARLHNLVPSVLLVMLGAWAGSGRSPSVLASTAVWVMSLISGGVAIASVVVNDYFDYPVDVRNAPHKPLPSGRVKPDIALLFSCGIYMAVLIAALFMESPELRSIVAFSAGATLLYTPLFKRLTAIKNATVASVIALAPIAGALAAGAGEAGMQRLFAPSLFAFCSVMYREVVMDLNDTEGDAAAGIKTLPVRLGKPRALLIAAVLAVAGGVGALANLVSTGLADWVVAVLGLAGAWAVALAVVLCATGQVVAQSAAVWRSGFDPQVVGGAVDQCLKPIGLGTIMLAALS